MSRRTVRRPLRFIALPLVLGAALALSGCGVKGPLEPPPSSMQPGPDGQKPKDTGIQKPDKPFILDGLL
ncbi:lipoprotein [Bosea sp. 117]|uniref:LPS translocon maturation chaperone LptM n=1 Tax=Bosea sp. 117 TaxID=1125973 RepID=UPI00049428E5|nr:lipoprotein [Bosea sp. 117]